MDLKSDCPFWLIKNGLMNLYPPLEADRIVDVAIVGGGITGALVADELVKAGLKCVLIDRRDIAQGSTSVSTALLQYEIDTHLVDLAEMIGQELATRAYQLCRDAIDRIGKLTEGLPETCEFRKVPSLYFASDPRDVEPLRKEFEARRAAKFKIEWLEAGAVKERFGFAAPCAVLSKDGGQVDPFRLTHRLLERATEGGLEVFDRTAVAHWEQTKTGIRLHTDRGSIISAGKVVFATGYESQTYLKQDVGALKSTYAILSAPVTGSLWEGDALVWETARPYLYFRRTGEGRILVGGEDDNFRNPIRRDASVTKKAAKLAKRFAELHPEIPLEVEYAWGGTFGETKDGLAYIGETPEIPNAYFAMGFGGNGITFSTIAAQIICDAILGKPNPDAQLFRFDR